LTGAFFDLFIDLFHDKLLQQGVISAEVEALMDELEERSELAGIIQSFFDRAYPANRGVFRWALLEARDAAGFALAKLWQRLSPNHLNYDDVGDLMLEVDREMTGGRFASEIIRNFRWREIGLVEVGPRRLAPGMAASHAFSARTVTPGDQTYLPRLSYRERWDVARRCHIVPS
jgi:hypothetical protein